MAERQGRVEVIAGPMFAGRPRAAASRPARRNRRSAGRRLQPPLDTRPVAIGSHHTPDLTPLAGRRVGRGDRRAVAAEEYDIVAIDEAQFFGPPLLDVVRGLAARDST